MGGYKDHVVRWNVVAQVNDGRLRGGKLGEEEENYAWKKRLNLLILPWLVCISSLFLYLWILGHSNLNDVEQEELTELFSL